MTDEQIKYLENIEELLNTLDEADESLIIVNKGGTFKLNKISDFTSLNLDTGFFIFKLNMEKKKPDESFDDFLKRILVKIKKDVMSIPEKDKNGYTYKIEEAKPNGYGIKYVITYPEFSNIISGGSTLKEALENAETALDNYLKACKNKGERL